MKNLVIFVLLSIISTQVMAIDLDAGSLDSMKDKIDSMDLSSDLVGTLTDELDVTDEQASGGVASLLSMAKNSLGSEGAALSQLIPSGAGGLSDSMLASLTNMSGVQSAFKALGMEPAMVSQFAPIVIDYAKKLGGADLASKLSSLWKMA